MGVTETFEDLKAIYHDFIDYIDVKWKLVMASLEHWLSFNLSQRIIEPETQLFRIEVAETTI